MRTILGKLLGLITSQRGQGVIRHLIGALGGILVGMGYLEGQTLEALTGSLATIYAMILSIKSKK